MGRNFVKHWPVFGQIAIWEISSVRNFEEKMTQIIAEVNGITSKPCKSIRPDFEPANIGPNS